MRDLYIPDPHFIPRGVNFPTFKSSPTEDIQDIPTETVETQTEISNTWRPPLIAPKPTIKSSAIFKDLQIPKNFTDVYNSVDHKDKDKRYNLFAAIAKLESSFNPKAQNKKSKATGWFQFMPTNIESFAKTDSTSFQNNPALQMKVMHDFVDNIERQFTDEDIRLAKQKGYSLSAMIAGAHFAGVNGLKNYLHKNINASDKHNGGGTDIKTRMDTLNNIFKLGGSFDDNIR